MLANHGGKVEAAVHYLVAVLGESEIPISEDIGGLPQVIIDEQGSPAESVSIGSDEEDGASSVSGSSLDDHFPVQECLPSYKDVANGHSTPPPSYDSLEFPFPSASPPLSKDATPSGTVQSLAHRIRKKRRQKKGYHSHGT